MRRNSFCAVSRPDPLHSVGGALLFASQTMPPDFILPRTPNTGPIQGSPLRRFFLSPQFHHGRGLSFFALLRNTKGVDDLSFRFCLQTPSRSLWMVFRATGDRRLKRIELRGRALVAGCVGAPGAVVVRPSVRPSARPSAFRSVFRGQCRRRASTRAMIARAPLPSPHALAAHANGPGYSTIPNEEEEKIDGTVYGVVTILGQT